MYLQSNIEVICQLVLQNYYCEINCFQKKFPEKHIEISLTNDYDLKTNKKKRSKGKNIVYDEL